MTIPRRGAAEAARRPPPIVDGVLRHGADQVRIRPWHHERDTAYVAPLGPVQARTVQRLLADLRGRGARNVVTAALSPTEQVPFLSAGFSRGEHLRVLERDLQGLPAPDDPASRPRRARRPDHRLLAGVDHAAFEPAWRLGPGGLDDALRATPSSRLRVVGRPGAVAYAVSGQAGRQGFVQRLAVDAAHRHRGLGSALVLDGLRWMRRRGARTALVNTQESNEAALALYQRLGFREQDGGLDVLTRPLD